MPPRGPTIGVKTFKFFPKRFPLFGGTVRELIYQSSVSVMGNVDMKGILT